MSSQNVVVLGASPKPERYSNQAVRQLLEHGHAVYPIHPTCDNIYEQTCYKRLENVPVKVDTLSMYVGPKRSSALLDSILQLKPKRIIMNPGTESDLIEAQATQNNIEVIRGCTLVMLRTQQF